MITATPLNNSEIRAAVARQAGRPVSLMCALGILAGSLMISHAGLVAVFKAGQLAGVMTLILVCLSGLQWMTMGRARAARAANARSQAGITALNAAIVFLLEATLNMIGVVQLAATGGADWGAGAAFVFAIAIACGIAWLNLTVKYAACEPLVAKAAPASPVTIEIEPPPASRDLPPNVHDITTYDRSIAGQSKDRLGVMEIYREAEAARQAEQAALAARKDPATGKWKKTETATPASTPAKRSKRKAA